MAAADENLVLLAHSDGIIDDEECILLQAQSQGVSHNPIIRHWEYPPFDLDSMTDDECKAEFRFLKEDVTRLATVFGLPEVIHTTNRHVIPSIEALCILLKRLTYPCWLIFFKLQIILLFLQRSLLRC